MLNIELLRNKDKNTIAALINRNVDKSDLDNVYKLDIERRQLIENIDSSRSNRNKTSKELSQMEDKPEIIIREMRELGDKIKFDESKLNEINKRLTSILLTIPNIPSSEVPLGKNEDFNEIIFSENHKENDKFTPLPHWDIASKLDLIDFERGAKL